MRQLALLTGLLLMTVGCIDLDRGDEPNQEPLAKAKTETAGPYEPETEIWFTGSGSSDPDGDGLDFFWDFDAADGDSQRIVGQGDNGRAAHTYHEEGSIDWCHEGPPLARVVDVSVTEESGDADELEFEVRR